VIELAVAAAGFVAWRARLPRREASAAAPPARFPRVSIVVPARDEEENLPALLASLAALDPAPAEVIVVDDGSTDRTAAIAAAAGARVVTPPPLPAGWTGKPWACVAGAEVATGELLLFTDADTVHTPASLGRAVARLEAERADLVSLVPSHEARAWWERLQGVFQLLLLVAAGRRYAIGQYLLFRRAAYERIGGHHAAPARIAEDLALASLVSRRALLAEPGLVRVRMYGSLGAFARGWTRNLRDGLPAAGWRGAAVVALIIGWLLGLPLHAVLSGDPIASAGAIATAVEVARQQRRVGRFSPLSALGYPLFTLVFVGLSAASALAALLRRPVTWRGRRFVPLRHHSGPGTGLPDIGAGDRT
jgi:4,4'-diaponeurosporenoate glycosyltransferase